MEKLDISRCVALETLHIRLLVYYDLIGLLVQWKCLMYILSRAPPTLRQVTIGFGCTTSIALSEICKLSWDQITTSFKDHPALEGITFQAEDCRVGSRSPAECARALDDDWKDFLRESIPDLHLSGRLQFL